MKKVILIPVFILLIITKYAAQVVVDIDPTFTTGIGANGDILKTVLQPDGKIIVYGNFTTYNNLPYTNFVRLNADGSLDATFNCGSSFSPQTNSYGVIVITLQADGKLLLGGYFTGFNGVACKNIVRLNSNGSIDNSFNASFNERVCAIATQSTGKIIVGGFFTNYNATDSCGKIARLFVNGNLDLTFQSGTGCQLTNTNTPYVLNINKTFGDTLLISGVFSKYNGKISKAIAKLYPNGKLDSTYTNFDGFNQQVSKIMVNQYGEAFCLGNFTTYKSKTVAYGAKLNRFGNLDTNYIFCGLFYSNTIVAAALKLNNELLVCGKIYPDFNNYKLTKLDASGSIDSLNFKTGNGFNGGSVYAINIQPNGKIIAAGNFNTYRGINCNKIVRLNEISVVGIKQHYINYNTKVYPNPANTEVIITTEVEGASITIYTIIGELVIQMPLTSTTILKVDELKAGTYLYKITKDNTLIKADKLIINH